MDYALISSYGTILGITDPRATLLALTKPYDILCSSLELRLDHEECNSHTSNTRDITGLDFEIDLSLYEYLPLPETGYIRLLEFEVKIRGNVKCILGSLSQHSFEEARKTGYKALSYAWGDPYRSHHLLCVENWDRGDVSRVPITANLAEWFRLCEVGTHVVWIDAICINQTDKIERARQVEQMLEVYRNAENVVASVGSISELHTSSNAKSTPDDMVRDSNALKILSFLQRDMEKAVLGPWHFLFSSEGDKLRLGQRLSLFSDSLRLRYEMLQGQLLRIYHLIRFRISPVDRHVIPSEAIYRWHYTATRRIRAVEEHPLITLLRRPYFTRRWIIQELGNAHTPNAITFQWDKLTFSPALIALTLNLDRPRGIPQNDKRAAFMQFSLFDRRRIPTYEHEMPAIDFLHFMEEADAFKCQDPRDRIFALTGMYPQLKFGVDYYKSIEEVYKGFAAYLIRTQPHCLPTLLACATRHRSMLLPSWVPDWRVALHDDDVYDVQRILVEDEAAQLPVEVVGHIVVSDSDAGRLIAAGFYVGFIAGPSVFNHDTINRSIYPVLTESRSIAFLGVPQDIVLCTGDLLFDLDSIFIFRPTSRVYIEARLTACMARDSLKWFPFIQCPLFDELESVEYSVDTGPCSLKSIGNRARRELSCLQDLSNTDDMVAWITGTRDRPPERIMEKGSHVYGEAIELPRSRYLAVFDIV